MRKELHGMILKLASDGRSLLILRYCLIGIDRIQTYQNLLLLIGNCALEPDFV